MDCVSRLQLIELGLDAPSPRLQLVVPPAPATVVLNSSKPMEASSLAVTFVEPVIEAAAEPPAFSPE
jgi:hypothetical protein